MHRLNSFSDCQKARKLPLFFLQVFPFFGKHPVIFFHSVKVLCLKKLICLLIVMYLTDKTF